MRGDAEEAHSRLQAARDLRLHAVGLVRIDGGDRYQRGMLCGD
jgi:hypothetical protein